jgi:hypothetical protein
VFLYNYDETANGGMLFGGQAGLILMRQAVPYCRVFTARQGRSGPGIEVQRTAVEHFAQAEGLTLLPEFVEVETGKGADALDRRPQLAVALAAARVARCPGAGGKA